MSNLGRPIEFDESKRNELCALLSAGCSLKHAAQFVGCSARTIRRHAEKDEAFRQRLRNAEASIRLKALETIRKAAASNWRAAVWLVQNGGGLEGPPEDHASRGTDVWEEILERLIRPQQRSTDQPSDLCPLDRMGADKMNGVKPRTIGPISEL